MTWQAIANFSNTLNTGLQQFVYEKQKKDAIALVPNLWADFVDSTSTHLEKSYANMDVLEDKKTGSLNCLTKFDINHEDYEHNSKPFHDYVIKKFDERTKVFLDSVNNSLAKQELQNRILNYKVGVSESIRNKEARIVHDKRHNMAIDAIEKYGKLAYKTPELYESFVNDVNLSIGSLALLPQEKEALVKDSRQKIAYAAAISMASKNPDLILNSASKPWEQDLSLSQIIKIQNQAQNAVNQRHAMLVNQISKLEKSHLESIANTGHGIQGFDNLLQSVLRHDDPRYISIKSEERFMQEQFFYNQEMKYKSFQESLNIVNNSGANIEDPFIKSKLQSGLNKTLTTQIKQAMKDPARFVEESFNEEFNNDIPLGARLNLRKQYQDIKGIPETGQRYLTNEEKQLYANTLQSKDPNKIKAALENIIDIDKIGIGASILSEVIDDDSIAPDIKLYAESRIYKNHELSNTLAQLIPIKDQLFSSMSKSDKLRLEKTIDENNILKKWYTGFIHGKPENIEYANSTKATIKDLARFYTLNMHMETGSAVKKAIAQVISENYVEPVSGLIVKRKLIKNGDLEELNSSYVNAALNSIRNKIIDGNIPIDIESTFLGSSTGLEIEKDRIKSSLSHGKWMSSGDTIYYTYEVGGNYIPVMKSPNEILTFKLEDLNTSEAYDQMLKDIQELDYGN